MAINWNVLILFTMNMKNNEKWCIILTKLIKKNDNNKKNKCKPYLHNWPLETLLNTCYTIALELGFFNQ